MDCFLSGYPSCELKDENDGHNDYDMYKSNDAKDNAEVQGNVMVPSDYSLSVILRSIIIF